MHSKHTTPIKTDAQYSHSGPVATSTSVLLLQLNTLATPYCMAKAKSFNNGIKQQTHSKNHTQSAKLQL